VASKLPLVGLLAGQTVYGLFRALDGTVWNGSGLVAYVGANFSTYGVAADNAQNAAGCYLLTVPALPAGIYSVEYRYQSGGAPAAGDSYAGSGFVEVDAAATLLTVGRRLPTASYTAPPSAAAVAAQVTADHGAGSYGRNT